MSPDTTRGVTPRFRRVLLKLSGEFFFGAEGAGIDLGRMEAVAQEIKVAAEAGVQLAVVIGGGNILRGRNVLGTGLTRLYADYIGMLATVMNGLALQDQLEALGLKTRLQTGIEIPRVAEPFTERQAISHLEKGRIVIFVGGTGSPYFTTDTAAALRAVQVGADVLLKATNVDGVYDKDPAKYPDARLLPQVDFDTALQQELGVMDSTAFSLCRDNNLPILVFNGEKDLRNIRRVVFGEKIGSIVGRMDDA